MKASWQRSRFQNTNYRVDMRNQFPGLYRATVEYDLDPLRRGRVKVRIPQMHGVPEQEDNWISTIDLPWAEPSFIGAGPDMGSFITPVIGTTVYVMFEAGDPNFPVYLGTIPSVEIEQAKPMGVVGTVPTESSVVVGQWETQMASDTPLDIYDHVSSQNGQPTKRLIYKSLKGHTFIVEDGDEIESLAIIDRIGQMFKMISPVVQSVNRVTTQAFQRGLKNVQDGTQFLYSQLVNSKAVMIWKDVAGQLLRFTAQQHAEKVELVSTNLSDFSYSSHVESGASGNVYHLLVSKDTSSNSTAYIEVNASTSTISFVIVSNGEQTAKFILSTTGITLNGSQIDSNVAVTTSASTLGPDITDWVDAKDETYIQNLR